MSRMGSADPFRASQPPCLGSLLGLLSAGVVHELLRLVRGGGRRANAASSRGGRLSTSAVPRGLAWLVGVVVVEGSL
jgi:hypothetical protein